MSEMSDVLTQHALKTKPGRGCIWVMGCYCGFDTPSIEAWAEHAATALGSAMAERMESEIRPLIDLDPYERDEHGRRGYGCCGCETYGQILDHAIRLTAPDAPPHPASRESEQAAAGAGSL